MQSSECAINRPQHARIRLLDNMDCSRQYMADNEPIMSFQATIDIGRRRCKRCNEEGHTRVTCKRRKYDKKNCS